MPDFVVRQKRLLKSDPTSFLSLPSLTHLSSSSLVAFHLELTFLPGLPLCNSDAVLECMTPTLERFFPDLGYPGESDMIIYQECCCLGE